MNSHEAKAWFEKHPFGTLRDEDGDLWRLRIAPKAGEPLHAFQEDSDGGPWPLDITECYDLDFVVESDGSQLDANQAEAWLRADPTRRLTDKEGDAWGIDKRGAFYEKRHDGLRYYIRDMSEFANGAYWQAPESPPAAPVTPAIATIGAAIDWLIANPGETLVDSDGDEWRLNGDNVQYRVEGPWCDASIEDGWHGLTWAPKPAEPVLPALPAGARWGKDDDGERCVLRDDPNEPDDPWGFRPCDDDVDAAILEALIAEYRARRPK